MKACLAIGLTALALAVSARADIVEEETWYNADGEVVKTVKRTYTGEDAQREADWEPAWVLRERARDARRPVRYTSSRRSYGLPYYGSHYFSGFRYALGRNYCVPRRYGRAGFRGHVRAGRGATRWGFGHGGRGVNLLITR